ncbi:serine/threonine protein kinase [Sphaeroforma arctica JP610]|uniref:Serine/threonine protein kinase n=1 Tax=Sphaeroforma arctica JP610 TaxID=667725 RepID=A0A0L0GG20_9EUKA|nr:serine/threonine protein kinase [Sphaeroforma arctica JP610]KNC87809.1 serine/threonine protein kinase [Sphaeroforma arctica JP610]|eukprot:XP_014161711.1 serine/threonine protein kinase [Sphaeroforma arctica JP610]
MKTSLLNIPWERKLQSRFHSLNDTELEKLRAALNCTLYLSLRARIGSPSLSAVVYKTEVSGFPVAVKFEPNMNKAISEVDIHYELTNRIPDYVLHYYDAQQCTTESHTYLILAMELATGDLTQVLRQGSIEYDELRVLIIDVFYSIEEMSKCSVYHGDLHAANIFVINRGGRNLAVIGDFGESTYSQSETKHLSDAYRFISSLIEWIHTTGFVYGVYDLKKALKLCGNENARTEDFVQIFDY